MDETFEEWVQNDAQQPCVRSWADELIGLGTSWDSFRRLESDIVKDLVEAGSIPLLAARDIVKIAKEEIEKGNAPMAIFWDLENMPIPSSSSGRDVSSRLKSILAPYGNLVQFRGYASIGLNLIPQQKRSDLQLSGCHLVDCPHNGRKEVADKMIIVDAMQFAFLNPDGATLCFITGDVDYAYLLAVLQRPSWRTIVISKGTISSMLHVNCDMRMRWETDILQLRPSTNNNNSPRIKASADMDYVKNYNGGAKKEISTTLHKEEADSSNQGDATTKDMAVVISPPQVDRHVQDVSGRTNPAANDNNSGTDDSLTPAATSLLLSRTHADASISSSKAHQRFEPLSPSEEWTDDVELLRALLKKNGNVGFKCTVGNLLRTTNPARFASRRAVRNFLTSSIEAGVVLEMGEGHYKELALPNARSKQHIIPVSKTIPQEMLKAVPEKVAEVSLRRPYVLFAPKIIFSADIPKPKGAYVKDSRGRWLILMFMSLPDAQRAVEELPQLSSCTLVDWRTCQELDSGDPCGSCCRCHKDLLESEIIYKPNTNSGPAAPHNVYKEYAYCSNCYEWNKGDGERQRAVDRVVSMLTMMADHDDVYVARKSLKLQLYLRYSGVCTTHKHAELWIDEGIRSDKLAPFKKEGSKKIFVCLMSHLQLANTDSGTSNDLDTSKEEKHVEALLLNETNPNHWVSRKAVNRSLQNTFPRMDSPFMRAQVFQSGCSLKRFCIAKGPFGQTVGLTEQDAQESLERMNKAIKEDLEWNFEGGSSRSSGGSSGGQSQCATEPVAKLCVANANDTDNDDDDDGDQVVAAMASAITEPGGQLSLDNSKSDVTSEWDGESIDSADIDAQLFGRSSTL